MSLQTNQNKLVKFDPTCLVAFLLTLLSIYYFTIGGVETGIIFIVAALVISLFVDFEEEEEDL